MSELREWEWTVERGLDLAGASAFKADSPADALIGVKHLWGHGSLVILVQNPLHLYWQAPGIYSNM